MLKHQQYEEIEAGADWEAGDPIGGFLGPNGPDVNRPWSASSTRVDISATHFPLWRHGNTKHYRRANVYGLHGGANKILHWPYSSATDTPDSFNFTNKNSKLVNNVVLSGSVAISTIKKAIEDELIVDRNIRSDLDLGIPPTPPSED